MSYYSKTYVQKNTSPVNEVFIPNNYYHSLLEGYTKVQDFSNKNMWVILFKNANLLAKRAVSKITGNKEITISEIKKMIKKCDESIKRIEKEQNRMSATNAKISIADVYKLEIHILINTFTFQAALVAATNSINQSQVDKFNAQAKLDEENVNNSLKEIEKECNKSIPIGSGEFRDYINKLIKTEENKQNARENIRNIVAKNRTEAEKQQKEVNDRADTANYIISATSFYPLARMATFAASYRSELTKQKASIEKDKQKLQALLAKYEG